MFLGVFFILVCFFTLLNFLSSNMFIWWSVFLLMTLVFMFLLKSDGSYSVILNYFIIQESLGLLFLVFSFSSMQVLVLMLKIGVSPFHFWVFSISGGLLNWNLIWFLTFQKLPFIPVLLSIFSYCLFLFLVLGILFVYSQLFLSKGFKNMMILSSVESFNWILLCCFFSLVNSLFLFVFYFLIMVFLMLSVVFDSVVVEWELVLVFMNIPFSVTFFVKIFSLSEMLLFFDFSVLLILLLMFMSLLSFSYWFFFVSLSCHKSFSGSLDFLYFIVFPLMFLSVI